MRLSVRTGLADGIPAAIDRALAAEAAGFDQIWFGNDIFGTSGIVALSAIAAATERIGLGIGVVEPVSLHPAQIAMAAGAIQDLSEGRFHLGIGAGSDVFFELAGLRPTPPVRRTRESIVAIRALLAGESPAEVDGAGVGWQPQARLHQPPSIPPPIYVGAMGPQMLRMAGRHADGALPLCLPPSRFRAADGLTSAGRKAAGATRPFDLAACVWCSIDDDADQARRAMAHFIARYSGSLTPGVLAEEGFDPEEFARVQQIVLDEGDDAGADAVSADMLRLGIVGGPSEVLDQCRALEDAGATHLSFGPPLGPDLDKAMGVLGRDVLPLLRSDR